MVEETRFYETKRIDLATANQAYEIYKLRGGETIVIKAKRGNTGLVYVGDKDVSTSNGFDLDPGESIEIVYRPNIPEHWKIDIYAVAATAGDDVAYMVMPAP